MKYSIEMVKEGKPSFFYTAQNVLLTLLPFQFYFPLPPQCYYFPSSMFLFPPWRMQIAMQKGEQQ